MSVQLLDKTRKINRLLHNSNDGKFVFSDICNVLGEILGSNVLVISRKGKLLGISEQKEIDSIKEMISNNIGECIDAELNERLLSILSTKENVNLTSHYTYMVFSSIYFGRTIGDAVYLPDRREL